MLSILENPAVRQRARPIDLRTYHWTGEDGLVEGKAEILRGVIIKKMSKSPLHEYVSNRLFENRSSRGGTGAERAQGGASDAGGFGAGTRP